MIDKLQLPVGVRIFEWCGAKVYLMEDIQEVAMAEVERLTEALPQWRREKVLAVKKEAMVKKTGTGISGGMKQVLDECQHDDIKTYIEERYVCSVAM